MIWATRSGSHTASTGSPARRSSSCDSCAASAGTNSAATRRGELADVGRLGPQLERARPPAATGRAGRWPACRRRSTCSRSWSRNCARVSSSRSSSSSSSRKPPSEKIGVRSSCEAVAMKRLRAVSSSASWRCISSSVARELAELVVARRRGSARREVAGARRAGDVLQPLDARGERARDAGSRRAARASSAIAPATRIALAHERDVGVDVVERRASRRRRSRRRGAWRSARKNSGSAASADAPVVARPRCRSRRAACAPPRARRRTPGRGSRRCAVESERDVGLQRRCVPRVTPSSVTRAPARSAAWRTTRSSTLAVDVEWSTRVDDRAGVAARAAARGVVELLVAQRWPRAAGRRRGRRRAIAAERRSRRTAARGGWRASAACSAPLSSSVSRKR